jgi:hypothetical protein
MHISPVTNRAPPSPWTVITENQLRGRSWIRSERAGLEASRGAGVRFSAAIDRSWGARRPVNAGLLALSTLQSDVRRRLLDAWMASGGGTASFFPAAADSLLDFIAEQLPDPSPQLALCRVEQLTLRATYQASAFEAPDLALLDPQRIVRRGSHAGLVLFPAGADLILNRLLQHEPPPTGLRNATPLLIAPGLQPLCRIASSSEHEIWTWLTHPLTVNALVRLGGPIYAIETMLQVGALEYE